jgi:hypothetical protein
MARTARADRTPPHKKVVTSGSMRMQAVETLIDEALEACEPYAKLVRRLRALRRGSEQYLELLSDVAVAAEIMSAKAEQVGQIIDQVMDTIPD